MNTNNKGLKLTYLSACLVSLFSSHAMAVEQNQKDDSVNNSPIERLAVMGSRQAYQGEFSALETP